MRHRATMLLIAAALAAGSTVETLAARPEAGAARIHDREFWSALTQSSAQLPAGEDLDTLVAELTDYLGSTDPELRDAFGYSILTEWIYRQGRLDEERLVPLTRQLLGNLRLGGGADGGDAVFRRSFSALMLSIIVARDVKQPTLPQPLIAEVVEGACRYAAEETDFRGWVADKGWAHAAAHTADLLRWLARDPKVRPAELQRLLGAVTALVARPHGTILAYGEDGRLAAAVLAVAQRDELDQQAWTAWAESLKAPLAADPQPSLDRLDEPLFAAQRNVRNLVYSTYVQLDLTPDLPASAAAVRKTLGSILLGK